MINQNNKMNNISNKSKNEKWNNVNIPNIKEIYLSKNNISNMINLDEINEKKSLLQKRADEYKENYEKIKQGVEYGNGFKEDTSI